MHVTLKGLSIKRIYLFHFSLFIVIKTVNK